MLASTASAPRVTRCSMGLYWSRDLCSKHALAGWGMSSYLGQIVRGSEIWWFMTSANSLSTSLRLVVNPFMPAATKTAWLVWWYLSNKIQISENIWRRNVDWNPTHNSPSNILRIYDWFQSYFEKCLRSKQHLSRRSPGINGWLTRSSQASSPVRAFMYFRFSGY